MISSNSALLRSFLDFRLFGREGPRLTRPQLTALVTEVIPDRSRHHDYGHCSQLAQFAHVFFSFRQFAAFNGRHKFGPHDLELAERGLDLELALFADNT